MGLEDNIPSSVHQSKLGLRHQLRQGITQMVGRNIWSYRNQTFETGAVFDTAHFVTA